MTEEPESIPTPEGDAGPSPGRRDRTPTPSGGRPTPRRFPGWLLIPLGGLAGWIVSSWMGAAFGALIGAVLWRVRA